MFTIFDEHKITDVEQYIIGRDNDKRTKALNKFMAKQMKKPRPRYLKKLRSEINK
jgi:hypothetical protein